MDEVRSEIVRRIADRVMAAPAGDRMALLDRECGDDAALRGEVLGRIRGAETAAPSEAATIGPDSAGGSALVRERPGGRVGPYKLVQLIGEGGFGSVFLAEQEKPVARKVALKIVKLGMDTGQVVARFEQERQALAIMDHPSIAKVLDAGATESGRPYFVMEYCPGEPIDEFCDRHMLSVDARLELFAQVCEAVQHAHSKGIIHRDIKPSNVLVRSDEATERRGEGREGRTAAAPGEPASGHCTASVKVIDFGIAKATGGRLTERTVFTEQRQMIGTPEYMSPEQAAGSADIDTRTDVYSLGVLLYQLLTGSTPFEGRDLRSAAFGEMQRIIRDVDPPKPSTRLTHATEKLAGIAASRRVEPRRLGALVRGELDWISMKAMEKDRARRYETANALAADVRRYLAGEAVLAAPASRAYLARKFIRRNRGLVAAGAVVTAALLLGIIGTSAGLVSAYRQRELARESEARAIQEARRAAAAEHVATARLAESEETVKFLDDMLAAVNPAAQGKDVSVRAVLDRAAGEIGKKFGDRPIVAARLHATIGRTYTGLSLYPAARPHVREAVEIRRRELGPEHEDTCRAVNELGQFLVEAGESSEAEALLKQAIADHGRLFGRAHPITLRSMDALAWLYCTQTRPAEGVVLAEEVLGARRSAPSGDESELVGTMNTLATIYTDLARFDEAERMYAESIGIMERLSGPEHPHTLDIRANLAWMLYWAGASEERAKPEESRRRYERSRAIGEQVVEVRMRVLGEEHQETLTSIGNLASVYRKLGLREKATELSKRDIEVSVRLLGEEHPSTIIAIANHGKSLCDDQRREEGIVFLERAIRNSRKALPPDNPGTAYALGWYGGCLRELGRLAEGETALLEAHGIVTRALGEDSPTARQMALDLKNLYEAWERANPGQGYAAKADAWRAKGPASESGR